MPGMAVFDTPAIPDGWARRDVIRIVDPLGRGAGWVDPALAGACAGYSVRHHHDDEWIDLLIGSTAGEPGCELLGVDPSGAVLPIRCLGGQWMFAERDPTSVTVREQTGRWDICMHTYCEQGVLAVSATTGALSRDVFVGLRLRLVGVQAGLSGWTENSDTLVFHSAHERLSTIRCSGYGTHPETSWTRPQFGRDGVSVDLNMTERLEPGAELSLEVAFEPNEDERQR